ncbi:MAG: lamin tail domain-containing protein [Acidobacteriota bacterium]
MKTPPLTLHPRIDRAVCLHAGAVILAALLAWWLAACFFGLSRATPFLQSANANLEIVISQIYGGGGSSTTAFRNDFVELFNRGVTTVSLIGWSLQYAPAGSGAWQKLDLSGSIAPGQYYLIALAPGGIGSKDLPAPDASGSIGIDFTAGKVALVKSTLPLINAPNSVCPSTTSQVVIIDFVGYGSLSVCYRGGAPAPSAGNSSAIIRRGNGCTDTRSNTADFVAAPPAPRNSASPLNPCGAGDGTRADLVVTTQTSSAAVLPRGIVSFLIKVFNAGPSPASNVFVTDLVPSGFVEIQSADSLVTGSNVSYVPIETLGPGQTASFTIKARAPNVAGRYVNRAVANSDTFDPATSNNTSLKELSVFAGAMFDKQDVQVIIESTGMCSASYLVETRITNTGTTTQQNNTGPEFLASLSKKVVASLGSCFATKGRCGTDSLPGSSTVAWEGDVEVGETVSIFYSIELVVIKNVEVKFCIDTNVYFDSDNDGQNDATTTVTECGGFLSACDDVPTEPVIPATSPVTDQKEGSILIFNLYTSSPVDPASENTRINITNSSNAGSVSLHLFFVSGDTCEVSDSFLCLTPEQTTSFLASDIDPGVTGFLIVMAVDEKVGCPIKFNGLIGDEYVKLDSGHAGNLGTESFAAIADPPCECSDTNVTATVALDGERYNQAPRTLIADGLTSVADNNSTLLILNRIGGDLTSHVGLIGDFSGLLFDDLERGSSFVSSGGCQFRQLISNTFPRTASRFPQFVPSGHTGWMKLTPGDGIGMLGAMLVLNTEKNSAASAFSGARNLHNATFTESATFKVPVFPSRCQ